MRKLVPFCSSLKALSFHAEAHEKEPETTKIDRQTVTIGATSPPVGHPSPPVGTSTSGSIEPVCRPFCTEFAVENASNAFFTFCRCLREKIRSFSCRNELGRASGSPAQMCSCPLSTASPPLCGSVVARRSSPLDRCRERPLLFCVLRPKCACFCMKTLASSVVSHAEHACALFGSLNSTQKRSKTAPFRLCPRRRSARSLASLIGDV